jgi:hypothetical protein
MQPSQGQRGTGGQPRRVLAADGAARAGRPPAGPRRCTYFPKTVSKPPLAAPPDRPGGFISHYPIQVIYPPGLTRAVQVGLGLFVVFVAVVGYGGYLHRHRPARAWRASH